MGSTEEFFWILIGMVPRASRVDAEPKQSVLGVNTAAQSCGMPALCSPGGRTAS